MVESVASLGRSLCYLDLTIVINDPTLGIEATQEKPVTPLCPTSCHASNVHKSWPNAVTYRVVNLSDSKENALALLLQRYIAANAHQYTISLLQHRNRGQKPPNDAALNRLMPIVLRYHPTFACAFQRALRIAPPPPDLELRIVPAFKNALPSLAGIVEKHNSKLCKGIFEKWEGSLCVSPSSVCPRFSNTSRDNIRGFTLTRILQDN